jgi:Drought induced 19 protein (Di19), zinc-binding
VYLISELYFGGEEPSATFMHHSLTCPYCGQFGLNEAGLVEHVDEEHVDDTKEVVSNSFLMISFTVVR